MWTKNYKNYPTDSPLKKETLSSGKGIIGCEMHEQMGWGETHHVRPQAENGGFFRSLLYKIFGGPNT